MRIAMNMLIRDEVDIIEYNIRYHASLGVDKFFIIDHLSKDGTPDVLASLKGEYDINVIRKDIDAYYQAEWMSELGTLAFKEGFDWAINNDADEFWRVEEGLQSYLSRIPQEVDSLQCPWKNVLPIVGVQPFFRNTWVQDSNMPKTMMRRHENVSVSVGNHWVYSSKVPWLMAHTKVYHYSNRDPDALYRKFVVGGTSLENTKYPEWAGEHWRAGLKAFREGTFQEFCDNLLLTEERVKALEGAYQDDYMKNILEKIDIKYAR